MALMVLALILLIPPITRHNEGVSAVACVMLFIGAWIDKGLGLISAGFVPNPLHEVNEYMPTFPEVMNHEKPTPVPGAVRLLFAGSFGLGRGGWQTRCMQPLLDGLHGDRILRQ